jgi:NADPH2:quinone reductase
LAYLRELGVQHPINYNTTDYRSVVRQVTGARGLDVVFDSIGGKSVSDGRKLLGAGGRMVCYGVAAMSGRKNIFRILRVALGFGFGSPIPLLQQSKGIIGVNMLRIADHRPEYLQNSIKAVVDLAAQGELVPHVGGFYPHTELAKAHEQLSNRSSIGKIALYW